MWWNKTSQGVLALLARHTLQCSVSTPKLHYHRHPNKPQLSSPVNQSRCLFNYPDQRGSFMNSSFQPLLAPSLMILSPSFYHSFCLDLSFCPPLFPFLLIYLAPSSLPTPFVLQCNFIFMDLNHSCLLHTA